MLWKKFLQQDVLKKEQDPGDNSNVETHLKDTKELGKWEQRHHTSIVIFI
jgi:hypothetical protein